MIFYHGSDHKITNFTDEFVGGEEAKDQEGPGIYFTSAIPSAERYGKYLHKVELIPSQKISNSKEGSSATRRELELLIRKAPDLEMHAQNWNQNVEIGIRVALDNILEYGESQHDQFCQVHIDFYPHDSVDYVRALTSIGYDLTLIDKEYEDAKYQHAVVFNPSIIKLVSIEDTHELERMQELAGLDNKKK